MACKGAGDGKYGDNDFWFFDELPSDEDVLRTSQDWERLRPPLPGHGWWPVLQISPQDPAWTGDDSAVTVGKKKILVVCFYQLLDGEVIHARWLTIEVDADV